MMRRVLLGQHCTPGSSVLLKAGTGWALTTDPSVDLTRRAVGPATSGSASPCRAFMRSDRKHVTPAHQDIHIPEQHMLLHKCFRNTAALDNVQSPLHACTGVTFQQGPTQYHSMISHRQVKPPCMLQPTRSHHAVIYDTTGETDTHDVPDMLKRRFSTRRQLMNNAWYGVQTCMSAPRTVAASARRPR